MTTASLPSRPKRLPAVPAGKGAESRHGGPRFGSACIPRFGSRCLAADQRGVAGVEYALLCALLVLALVTGIAGVGTTLDESLTTTGQAFGQAAEPGNDDNHNEKSKGKGQGQDKKNKKDK